MRPQSKQQSQPPSSAARRSTASSSSPSAPLKAHVRAGTCVLAGCLGLFAMEERPSVAGSDAVDIQDSRSSPRTSAGSSTRSISSRSASRCSCNATGTFLLCVRSEFHARQPAGWRCRCGARHPAQLPDGLWPVLRPATSCWSVPSIQMVLSRMRRILNLCSACELLFVTESYDANDSHFQAANRWLKDLQPVDQPCDARLQVAYE